MKSLAEGMDVPRGTQPSYLSDKAIVRRVRDELRKNSHYTDGGAFTLYFVPDTFVSATSGITDISEGTSEMQRTGKRVRLMSMQIRGCIYWGPAAPLYPLYCVLLVVYDRAPTGSLPALTDIISSNYAGAMNNAVNSERFRIVMRRAYGVSFTMQIPIPVEEFIDLSGLSITYGAATNGALTNIRDGALYVVAIGNESAVFPYSTAARIDLSTRVRFINEL